MIDRIIARARRRILWHRLLTRMSVSGTLFLVGFVLLLLLGTRIFDWWILVALGAAASAVALFQTFFRAPSPLRVARSLDQTCALSDSLSTALHFRDSQNGVAALQRRHAESLAETIDLPAALPFRRPRSVYALASFCLLASFLFIFRFGFEQHLSLDRPISFLPLDPLTFGQRNDPLHQVAQNQKTNPLSAGELARLGTSTPDNPGAQDMASARESALANGSRDSGDLSKTEAAGGKKSENEPTGKANDGSSSDPADGVQKPNVDQQPSSQEGEPQGGQQGNKSPGRSDGSSLLSKLKDAVSGLMSKMKPQPGQGQPQNGQPQNQQSQNKPSGQQGTQKGQQGQKGDSADQQQGEESASSDEQQSAPGKGSGKTNDQNAAAKPGSGMGHQDGSKELKDAEQLAAMGKLSEIIGKRSAAVTGEMTIDQQGPQQLRTGYTNSTATHGETAGDVSRDEVPVALQNYVAQYFEQVRKQSSVKTARAGKPPAHQ